MANFFLSLQISIFIVYYSRLFLQYGQMYLHKRLEENVRTYKKLLAEWRKQMEALTEIRWHGRGGQGAKTAALLLAEAAFNIGKHVQ